jgi:hypothetical protein
VDSFWWQKRGASAIGQVGTLSFIAFNWCVEMDQAAANGFSLSGGSMEHAVILHLPLDGGPFILGEQRDALYALENELSSAIELAEAGEFDGSDFDEGECMFYMHGPDADTLFKVIKVVLEESPIAHGGFAIKHYGPAEAPNSKDVCITW